MDNRVIRSAYKECRKEYYCKKMKEIRVNEMPDAQRWKEFVYNHPRGNIFHTPEMFEIYRNSKKWRPLLLSATGVSGAILGILLIAVQSERMGFLDRYASRAVVWGGPLVKEGDGAILDCFLRKIDEMLKDKVAYVQFRNLDDVTPLKQYFIANEYRYMEHLNFLIDLSMGPEHLWKSLLSRRNVRKAEREGVAVRLASSPAEVEESYFVIKDVYKRIRYPLPDKGLFEFSYKVLGPKAMIKIFLATYARNTIGVLYVFAFREKLHVWYSGSLSRCHDKRPNDILYWEAIKWGCRNGYKMFDLGGAGSPHREYGVRGFKKKFGGRQVNYGRFEKIYAPFTFRMTKIGLAVWQRLGRF